MTIVKLKSFFSGDYEYCNSDHIVSITVESDRYEVTLTSGGVMRIDKADTFISTLISTANANF